MFKDLQSFIQHLKNKNQIIEITEEVDANLEVAEIHRRVIDQQGPALLFKNVKNASFPLATNLFGTTERVDMAFGSRPKELIERIVTATHELVPPSPKKLWGYRDLFKNLLKVGMKKTNSAPVKEVGPIAPRLDQLPIITSWHTDGGPFVTLPMVYTEHPTTKIHNLGMYRIHVHTPNQTGIHWQIHKGSGFHYHEAEKLNQALPVNLYVGGPPALILSAIAPLPENAPELLLCSLLQGAKLNKTKDPKGIYDLIGTAEFAFVGEVKPHTRKIEGPFGDHYGYNSLAHEYPIFDIKHMYHRKNAIYPATVVGKPKQEDFFIGDYLQDLLSPLFPVVMPAVEDLWSYGDTGFHSLTSAVVKVRYPKEAFASGLRILGEGQLSLTKILFLIDQKLPLKDIKKVLTFMAERINFKTDLFIFSNISQDTLDYTGPKVNEGSKMLAMATGEPIRKPPQSFSQKVPYEKVEVFCPGVMIVEGDPYSENKDLPQNICHQQEFSDWAFIFLVDKNSNINGSCQKFLWITFTRFEPANDVHSKNIESHRFHHCLTAPIVIDCRKKPWHTEELEVDDKTKETVDKKWHKIMPPEYR